MIIKPIELDWFDPYHGIAYGTLAWSLEYALANRELPAVRLALLAFAAAVGYGVLMEAGQLVRPGRVASVADAASTAVGAGTVLTRFTRAGTRSDPAPSSNRRERWNV